VKWNRKESGGSKRSGRCAALELARRGPIVPLRLLLPRIVPVARGCGGHRSTIERLGDEQGSATVVATVTGEIVRGHATRLVGGRSALVSMPGEPRRGADASNGYERAAAEYMQRREHASIGVALVRDWARSLPSGASLLDLGCGHGVPISEMLMEEGLAVHGVDASPTLTAAFRERFPHASVACEAVEDSRFFDRTFDAIIAVGLIFLLPAAAQRDLILRVGRALEPQGRFLFTAPTQSCTWVDVLTGHPSVSLGSAAYERALRHAGLTYLGEYWDEGENHYYEAQKR